MVLSDRRKKYRIPPLKCIIRATTCQSRLGTSRLRIVQKLLTQLIMSSTKSAFHETYSMQEVGRTNTYTEVWDALIGV